MKYAKEVMDLMAAYPGRGFRMTQIVNHVGKGRPKSLTDRDRLRKGVSRVLESLEEQGVVVKCSGKVERGSHFMYSWKVGHGVVGKWDAKCDNTSKPSCAYRF